MRLKHYTVKSMQEGLRLIQKDLGDDAVMLSSRTVTLPGGEKGIEITAAVDKFTPAEKSKVNEERLFFNSKQIESANSSRYIDPESIEEKLLTHGICGKTAAKIAKAVKALESSGFETEDALEMILGKIINFQISSKILKKHKNIVLIGSTGAGKTTTMAKLAVEKVSNKKSIGLITMDNYKIGAKEQVKIFADALNVDFCVTKSPEELKEAVNFYNTSSKKDFIFIDSAGINPFSSERMKNLKKMLAELDNPYIMLVLPANLNIQELAKMPFLFKGVEISGLVFSKLDETAYLGGILNAAIDSQLEVCFATDGQNIPHDILELDAKSLARRLLQENKLWENS